MAESEAIAAALLTLGWTRATDAAGCDVAILNTCTVTGEADAKNRKALRTLLRAGKAAIIVTGCAVNIDTARYADVDPRIICEHDKERIPALANRLHEAVPRIALSTDVIVGFPGETEDDFARTCKLVERCGFMRLHVFRYSKRPGTPAAIRDDQVDPKVKAARSQILIDLGRRLALSDMERRLGTIEEVVIERPGIGTSESYHAVACDTALPVGALAEVEFNDIDTDTMRLIGR